MESIGKILKKARENAGFSIDQAARETHISKRYLVALEEEDFTVFPGEPYTIGFLRNYAEYLELDADELVGLYKNLKIQEQPVPIDELLDVKKKKFPIGGILLVVIIVVLLGVGGYFGYKYFVNKPQVAKKKVEKVEKKQTQKSGTKQVKAYLFREEAITKWFDKGQSILYQLEEKSYSVEIADVDSGVVLRAVGKDMNLPLGGKVMIDFNEDSQPDLRITLNDIDKVGDRVRVNLGLYKITKPITVAEVRPGNENNVEAQNSNEEASIAANTEEKQFTVVKETPTPGPVIMKFNFRGYCFFRYLVDDKERVEKFFHKGESFVLDIKNYATLWISNAGVVKVNIAGKDVDLGRPGQVVTKRVHWVKKDDGIYRLLVTTLY